MKDPARRLQDSPGQPFTPERGPSPFLAFRREHDMTQTTTDKKNETPEYQSDEPLVGEDGNAFAIMGRVSKGLRRDGAPSDYISAVMAEMMESDYDALLAIAMRYSREP